MPSPSASPDPVSPEPSEAGATLYDRLQMPPSASQQQLRQSFRRLSKRYHPDTTTLPAPLAEQAFQELQRAYAVLSDPSARKLYDERLRLARLSTPGASFSATPPPTPLSQPAPVSLRRALSGGEWFALLLLAIALVLSLVLGIGVAWARGAEMMRWPSWWTDLHPAAMAQDGAAAPMAEPDHAPAP